jgi:hypothetical protein
MIGKELRGRKSGAHGVFAGEARFTGGKFDEGLNIL